MKTIYSGKSAKLALKAAVSYVSSATFRSIHVWNPPFVLMVEPTNICNLHCRFCPTGMNQPTRGIRGYMDMSTFERILVQTNGHTKLLQLWNRGEPFLNRDLEQMIRMAADRAIYVRTSTNGHFLAERAEKIVRSGLNELIVSLDGSSPETYSTYRKGGSFDKVIDGIRAVISAKRRTGLSLPKVNIQFILMRHNEDEIDQLINLASNLCVDSVSLKTVRIETTEQALSFLPTDPRFSRYELKDGNLRTKRWRNGCGRIWFGTVINWNGNVVPCCFDQEEDFKMGNVLQDHLQTIWQGEEYRRFRKAVLIDRNGFSICLNCTEGLKRLFVKKVKIT